MTPRNAQAVAELERVLPVLAEIAVVVDLGREAFDTDAAVRRQLRYPCIVVGSALKNYCEILDIERGSSVFSPAIGFRNVLAYRSPDKVSDVRVWGFSSRRVAELRAIIDQTVRSLQ